MSDDLTIVMYHYVRDLDRSAFPRIKGLDIRRFRSQLDHLQSQYNIVNYGQIRQYCIEGRPLPRNACWLTFDDGYCDHHRVVLPELQKRGLHGAFFPSAKSVDEHELLRVNKIHFILASVDDPLALVQELKLLLAEIRAAVPLRSFASYWDEFARPGRYDDVNVSFVKRMLQHALPLGLQDDFANRLFEKYVSHDMLGFAKELYMSKADLRDLVDAGMYIGSHGYTHAWLDRSPPDVQAVEIDRSLAFLSTIGAPAVKDWVMCYPYGGYNAVTLDLLRDRHCLLGLTTVPGVANLASGSWLELPRLDTNDLPQ